MRSALVDPVLDRIDVLFGVFTALLFVVGFALLIRRSIWPAWKLLAASLHHHSWRRYSLAGRKLFGLLGVGLRTRSLYAAARLRIESELVRPAPEPPMRLGLTDQEFSEARRRHRADKRRHARDLRSSLLAMRRTEDETAVLTLEIDTCSPLIDNDGVQQYFNALRTHHPLEPPAFLSRLAISSGFVAPLHLLTGVLARYGEQWQPIVEGYGRSVIRQGDPLRHTPARRVQSFIFDCWLMWGPSIPVCTCPQWYGDVALQYGYGDENNSLTLRCSSPELIRSLLLATDDATAPDRHARRFAVQSRVTGTLRWGPGLRRHDICPAQSSIWRDDRLVLDVTETEPSLRSAGGTEEQVSATYYSAYLWVAFVLCDASTGEPLHPDEPWRNLVPFFEHGNIADPAVYDFHKEQLAAKALHGALRLLETHRDLRLRFVCAIDEACCGHELRFPTEAASTIRAKMRALHRRDRTPSAPRRRLVLDDTAGPWRNGDYSACALPEIVQGFYDNGESTVAFREIRPSHPSDEELLERFYALLADEFPEDERESLVNIRTYLRKQEAGGYGLDNYHVLVALDGDQPVGGSICDYFAGPNAGVIEFLFVDRHHRTAGVGSRLLEETERILHDDAQRSRGAGLGWIVAEMDDPYLARPAPNRFDPFRRARVWDAWGYSVIDMPYVQPALSPDQQPVHDLLLMAKPGTVTFSAGIPTAAVQDVLHHYLRLAMRIERPEDNPEYRRMRDFLTGLDHVGVTPLAEYIGYASPHLFVSQVSRPDDPELDAALAVYTALFADPATALTPTAFRDLLGPHLPGTAPGFRHHLWSIRRTADDDCEGVVAFATLPDLGFGCYLGLTGSLRGAGLLRPLLARIEERMVRDRTGARGWFIECGPDQRTVFLNCGFAEVTAHYRRPPLGGAPAGREWPRLHLLYKPFGRTYGPVALSAEEVCHAVREIYRLVYGHSDSDADAAVNQLAAELAGDAADPLPGTGPGCANGTPAPARVRSL